MRVEVQLKTFYHFFLKVWSFPPVPVFMKFYVFNIENPDNIRRGEKPRVKEVGPFVYREYREKKNLRKHADEIEYGLNVRYEYKSV